MPDDSSTTVSPLPAEPIAIEYQRGARPVTWPYHVAFWLVATLVCTGVLCLVGGIATQWEWFAFAGGCVLVAALVAWPLSLVLSCVYAFQGKRRDLDPQYLDRRDRLILLLVFSPFVAFMCVLWGAAVVKSFAD